MQLKAADEVLVLNVDEERRKRTRVRRDEVIVFGA